MLIKIKDVCRILKTSRNTLYNLQRRDPTFPKPIKMGDKKQARIFFRETELEVWILNLKAENTNV
ncbi:helix-turn-helix transcriptional regulator [Acinetobacter ursingii]|uniref:helix-turn-helix transcriptional regulator n=1 Tax=Acinetobacter ursingii TaxID=108980 RepID=UPI0006975595|nr:helix-turn-helix domain-containing protein [Acinetobacter ursingii]